MLISILTKENIISTKLCRAEEHACPGALKFSIEQSHLVVEQNMCFFFFFFQFSRSVLSDSLWPHGRQHARLPCPSPTPRVYLDSCPLSWWCHPTTSSSVVPFSSRLQSFPASGSFPVSQFFATGGQSIGVLKFSFNFSALVAQMVKNPPAMWDTWVWSLGWEDPLKEGIATHSSILTWRIPRREEPGDYSLWGHKELDMTEPLTPRTIQPKRGFLLSCLLYVHFHSLLFSHPVETVTSICFPDQTSIHPR